MGHKINLENCVETRLEIRIVICPPVKVLRGAQQQFRNLQVGVKTLKCVIVSGKHAPLYNGTLSVCLVAVP